MSTSQPRSPHRRSPIRPWMVGAAIAVVVVVIAGFNVKVVSLDEVAAENAAQQFDPVAFVDEIGRASCRERVSRYV